MNETWFTADLHIGHKNIVRLANRPFASTEEHDEALIDNWNLLVRPGDNVYFLGDMSFMDPKNTEQLLRRLRGQIHVVAGNHDSPIWRLRQHFASYEYYKEIKVAGQHIVLSHWPFAEWNRAHHRAWHLHGHQHGNGPKVTIPRLDIGVDCFHYFPVAFESVREIMAGREWTPVSHH